MVGPDADDDSGSAGASGGRTGVDHNRCRNPNLPTVHPGAGPQVHRRRSHEAGNERVGRPLEHLERRPQLLERTVPHDRDTGGQGHRLFLVVGHVHHGGLQAPVQQRQLGARAHAPQGIEIRQRLVEQECLRLAHDGSSQRHALPLAARQLCGPAIEEQLDAEHRGRLLHTLVHPRGRHAADTQAERQILADGLVRVERVALKHHGQIAETRLDARHVAAADQDPPRGGFLETGDQAQHGALAAPGRPEQDEQLAVGDLQRDVACGDSTFWKHFAHLLERDGRHQPFTAPAVSPAMMRRCATSTTVATGTVATTAAASTWPHGT